MGDVSDNTYSRRQVLAGGIGGMAALSTARLGHVRTTGRHTVERAAAVKAAGSDLGAVKHVVFLMQENRSFDHYFGTLGGVAGFSDTTNRSAFTQAWPGGEQSTLLPFHMNTRKQAECTYDLDHSWVAEHDSINGGAMDSFVSTHTSTRYEGALGINTMGYYKKADLPFYYALAEKFTICDHYFCSIQGPTHPNRLMSLTGTIDPAGVAGGPIWDTASSQPPVQGTCSWETMPEVLQANGISWKAYNPYGSLYQPGSPIFINKNVLLYFDQFVSDPTSPLYQNAFNYYGPNVANGLTSTNPNESDFAADVANDTLPQVSWIISPDTYDEHPPAPPALGEWYTQQILDTLLSNPSVWASTVLFVMYDENDGFFDHLPPPLAPAGTEGEYLTADPLPSGVGGITGPLGLGVRVPMIVVSPFSAGGYVSSETFDHTSQLKFLETLFGVTAPNISAWRRSQVGDLTSTLPVLGAPVTKEPKLPRTSDDTGEKPIGPLVTTSPTPADGECTNLDLLEDGSKPTAPFTVPRHQKIPVQTKSKLIQI
jgi:phospholipase C